MPPPPDEFASITESAPLAAELRERIRATGPMTFRAFMDAALYHPRYGYYRTQDAPASRGGDYVTSPEVHPVFGALVARQLDELHGALGRPSRFDVVEQGAGRGLLARDVLCSPAASAPPLAGALRYAIVEPSPHLCDAQRRTLEAAGIDPARVAWSDRMRGGIEGCVITNELVDAFPVHRVVRRGDELREVYVALDGNRFVDREDALSTPALDAYFAELGLLPGDGCYAEVNLDAPRWIAEVSASIARGYVLTFDYGYEGASLYAPWRRDGTLLCFYRQSASSDPYQRIGKQDMTASVDFTTLRRAGERAGLRHIATATQSDFLVRLGIGEGLATIARDRPEEIAEYFARRNVVLDLIDPGRLGRITVLLQGKGVPDDLPRGFRDG